MLKKRIIPKLLCVETRIFNQARIVLVNTTGFDKIRIVGDPVSQAKIYESQISDEIIVLDIRPDGFGLKPAFLDTVRRLASETFMPLTVGGGVRNEKDFLQLLSAGADKISINFQALNNPEIISKAAKQFGSQCVVVSIDHLKADYENNRVYDSFKKNPTNKCPIQWAKEVVDRGAGEVFLTDVNRDGSGLGLNLELAKKVSDEVDVPVVISGGCGLAEHFVQGFCVGGAEGVAAGTFFSKKDQNPLQVRSHVSNANIPIRMEL